MVTIIAILKIYVMKRIYKFKSGKCFILMLTGILIVLVSNNIRAQVRTTILAKDQDIQSIMYEYTMYQPSPIILPKVDVRKVLEQDRLNHRRLPRFGIKIPVTYTENEGIWYENDKKNRMEDTVFLRTCHGTQFPICGT